MRPFMMPVFFYGGQISKALESASLNAAQQVALTEIRSLLTWLLMQLGVVNREQADVLLRFQPLPRPSTLDHRAGERGGAGRGGAQRPACPPVFPLGLIWQQGAQCLLPAA